MSTTSASGGRSPQRRLRTMTIGTTILGVAATGLFGGLAALGQAGESAQTANPSITTPTETATEAPAQDESAPEATAAPRVSRASGPGHASSGGS